MGHRLQATGYSQSPMTNADTLMNKAQFKAYEQVAFWLSPVACRPLPAATESQS